MIKKKQKKNRSNSNQIKYQIFGTLILTICLFKNHAMWISTIPHVQCSLIFFGFFMKRKPKTYLVAPTRKDNCNRNTNNFLTEGDFEWDWYSLRKKNVVLSQENQGVIYAEAPKEKKDDEKKRLLKEIPWLAQQNADLEKAQHMRKKYAWFWKNAVLPYLVCSLFFFVVFLFFNFLGYVLSSHPFSIVKLGLSIFNQYQDLGFGIFCGTVFGGIFFGFWSWRNIRKWRLENMLKNGQYAETNQHIQNEIKKITQQNIPNIAQENRELNKIYQKLIQKKTILELREAKWQLNRGWRSHPMLYFWSLLFIVFLILLVFNFIWYNIWPNTMYTFWKYVYMWIKN